MQRRSATLVVRFVFVVALTYWLKGSGAGAQTFTWSGPFGGPWSNPAHWTPAGGPPNAAGAEAIYAAPSQTSVDGSFRVGRLTFQPNVNGFTTTLTATGGGQLFLDNGTSAAVIAGLPSPTFPTRVGAFTISTPLTIAGNNVVQINQASGNTGFGGTGSGVGTISGVISGTDSAVEINSGGQTGVVAITGASAYGGAGSVTTVRGGTLRARDGTGLPANTALRLDGGVLEDAGSSPATFVRPLGTGVGEARLVGPRAGFSAFSFPLAVRLNNSTAAASWGQTDFNPNALVLGAASGFAGVTFENGLLLNGAQRTVEADTFFTRNSLGGSSAARVAGAITNGSASAGLTKAGQGVLILDGANTYTGPTVVQAGGLRAADGVGLPAASNLTLNGGVYEAAGTASFNRPLGGGTGQVQFGAAGGGFASTAGTLTVDLFGDGRTLTWGGPGFVPGGASLQFGLRPSDTTIFAVGASADGTVDFRNGIDFAGGVRTLAVNSANTPIAELFLPRTAPNALFSGVLANGGVLVSPNGSNVAVAEFSAANTYAGTTTVRNAVLRAADGQGLPTASNLTLDGGVLEGRGPTTFSRPLGTAAGQVQFGPGGGGFSASGGPATVALNGGAPLTWGATPGFHTGTGQLVFGSLYSDARVDFQNPIDLGGGTRVAAVRNNLTTAADITRFSGVISNGGLTKDDRGTLELTAANTYAGPTTVSDGAIRAVDGVGLPAASNLSLNGGVFEGLGTTSFTRAVGTGAGQVQFLSRGGGFAANGGVLTVQLNGSTAPVTVPGDILRFGSATADNVADVQNAIQIPSFLSVRANAPPGYGGAVGRLSGVLSGAGGLQVNTEFFTESFFFQTGTVELTAANTYAGTTFVFAGRLVVNNASGSGTGTGNVSLTQVSSEGFVFSPTLAGSGRIAPAPGNSVDIFGRLAPGGGADNSLRIETAGTGALRLGSGSTWGIRVLAAGPGGVAANSGGSTLGTLPEPTNNTFLDVTGIFTLVAGTRFEIDGTGATFTPGQQYSYAIGRTAAAADLNGGVPLSVTDPTLFTTVGFVAVNVSVASSANGVVYVNFTPVPEPHGILVVVAVAGLLARQRRRKPERRDDSPSGSTAPYA